MRPSHPPTLLTLATRAVRQDELFVAGDRVLVAVSGGPDSMALLHVLSRLRGAIGHELCAHGVDHGLRREARLELDLAETFAHGLGVPFGRTELRVAPGGNLQARARAARYDALAAAAQARGARIVATAHHADDRAETVLLRLLRGAGPDGLAVLGPVGTWGGGLLRLVRPFLRAPREAVLAHLDRHSIPFSRDPSNDNPRFLRTRVRHELLPLLRELSPHIVAHLCALADQLGQQRAAPPHMHALPRATREALAALARTRSEKARVALPGGLVAALDRAKLDITRKNAGKSPAREVDEA